MYALYYTGYGCTNFPRVWEPPQSSRSQKGNVKLLAHWGPTNVIRNGNLSPGICGRLIAHFLLADYLLQSGRQRPMMLPSVQCSLCISPALKNKWKCLVRLHVETKDIIIIIIIIPNIVTCYIMNNEDLHLQNTILCTLYYIYRAY